MQRRARKTSISKGVHGRASRVTARPLLDLRAMVAVDCGLGEKARAIPGRKIYWLAAQVKMTGRRITGMTGPRKTSRGCLDVQRRECQRLEEDGASAPLGQLHLPLISIDGCQHWEGATGCQNLVRGGKGAVGASVAGKQTEVAGS